MFISNRSGRFVAALVLCAGGVACATTPLQIHIDPPTVEMDYVQVDGKKVKTLMSLG